MNDNENLNLQALVNIRRDQLLESGSQQLVKIQVIKFLLSIHLHFTFATLKYSRIINLNMKDMSFITSHNFQENIILNNVGKEIIFSLKVMNKKVRDLHVEYIK